MQFVVEGYLRKMSQTFNCLFLASWLCSFHHGLQWFPGWPKDLGPESYAALIIFWIIRANALFMSSLIMTDVITASKVKVVRLALLYMQRIFIIIVVKIKKREK